MTSLTNFTTLICDTHHKACAICLCTYQNSPSAIFLTANRSLSIAGTSSHSSPPLAQAPTYSPPGPRGFLNFTNCTASPPKVSTYNIEIEILFQISFIITLAFINMPNATNTNPLNCIQSVVDSHLYSVSELFCAGTYLR